MHTLGYEDTSMIDMWHPRLRIYVLYIHIYYVCLSCQRIASCNCARCVSFFLVVFFNLLLLLLLQCSSAHFTSALSARAETRWFMVAKVAIQWKPKQEEKDEKTTWKTAHYVCCSNMKYVFGAVQVYRYFFVVTVCMRVCLLTNFFFFAFRIKCKHMEAFCDFMVSGDGVQSSLNHHQYNDN